MKRSELPGVVVHKSIKDALASIRKTMEDQHFVIVNRDKAKAAAARKAGKPPPR